MKELSNSQEETYEAEVLPAFSKTEIDIQIATAKQYPRNVKKVLDDIRVYATMDEETAEDCFYALVRGKGKDEKIIEGISVRLAEIFASCWGNLRIGTRIIANDGKSITAQGICHDLESNLCVSVEVKRSILTSNGFAFSNDMQVVTGNAAASIAFRNAVLKVIPKAVTKKIVTEIRELAKSGDAKKIEEKRKNAILWFTKRGVTIEQILNYIGAKTAKEIDSEKLMTLRSTCNAINEGTTSIEELFSKTVDQKKEDLRNNPQNINLP